MGMIRFVHRLIQHLTPQRMQTFVQYHLCWSTGKLEKEVRYLPHLAQSGTVAIDIGANWGMYTYAMQRYFQQVYAFEPHPHFAGTLRELGDGTEVFNIALSDRRGRMELHVPLQDSKTMDGRQVSVPLYGWSTLSPSSTEEVDPQSRYQKHTVNVDLLDTFALENVAIIKIDVEGHELEVLKGSYSTICQNRPSVIIEVKKSHRDAVHDFFKKIEYNRYTLSDLFEEEGTPANEIYLPSEAALPSGTALLSE